MASHDPTRPRPFSIPFNRPSFAGNEQRYMAEAIAGGQISGDGPFTRRCHDWLEKTLPVGRALLTTSCTHSLEMAALLLSVGPGDEVIVPSFTFVSTANAFAMRGATVVFCDIRRDTLNLDESLVERLVTPRTRGIVVVHYAGVGCEMDALSETAAKRGLWIVEDDAHGLFGSYRGRSLGSFGALATLSFHETKNVTCGEGGALLINDASLVERAEIVREKGTDRSRFFRGQVDRYTWVDLGSSWLPSELLAAFLWAQFEAKDRIQARRKQLHDGYTAALAGWAERHGVGLPFCPAHCRHPSHLYFLLLHDLETRGRFIVHMRERGILAAFHYLPLHRSPAGQRFGSGGAGCPVTEEISDRLVRLPLYNDLSDEDHARVIEAVTSFCP